VCFPSKLLFRTDAAHYRRNGPGFNTPTSGVFRGVIADGAPDCQRRVLQYVALRLRADLLALPQSVEVAIGTGRHFLCVGHKYSFGLVSRF
jgi:hypothetical protein